MTQRERPTPDAGPTAPAGAAAPVAPSVLAAGARNGCGGLWEDLFQRASAEQQQDLLALAARQGVVYAHQVAPPENGPARPARRTLLPALLNGQTKDLEAVLPPPLEIVFDSGLDPCQREAVARAVQTPDVCLIQGTPGTGKSRLVAEPRPARAVRGPRAAGARPRAGTTRRQ